ncbi:DEAD/DEAH box helicase [Leptolyngbya sp. 'hensonii']|uniref:DEAD/DEAH box helicase n=1 Tax=Leptolyngbya sp. 'hensonii' TaxID=1922337 RepID=UPI00209ABF68|nr:DEAD/DEAH box helicase [Leptolyngbya sp. 'hensonii']
MDSETAELQTQLIEQYHQLSPLEQQIVQVLSIIYDAVARTMLIACLNHMGTRDAQGKPLISATLKPHIDRLLELGIVTQAQGQGPCCHPLLVEVATRHAVALNHFEKIVQAVEEKLPITSRWGNGPRYFSKQTQLIREVRIGFYRQDIAFIEKQFEDYYRYNYQDKIFPSEIFQQICNNPFDPEWFSTLHLELYEITLTGLLNDSMLDLTPAKDAFNLLLQGCVTQERTSDNLCICLIEQLILRGRLSEAHKILEQLSAPCRNHAGNLQGWLYFMQGDYERAIEQYTLALQTLKKATGKRKIYFQSMSGLFFILALLKQGSPEQLREAEGYAALARQSDQWLSPTYGLLESVLKLQQGDLSQKDWAIQASETMGEFSIELLFRSLCLYWVDADRAKKLLPQVVELLCEQAETAGYDWLTLETAALLSRLKPRGAYSGQAETLRQKTGICPMVDLLQPREPWDLCLSALANLRPASPQTPAKSEATQRLVWFITYTTKAWLLQPREQTITAKGDWSKGRNIALKRLKNNLNELTYFTPQDREVCAHLKALSSGYYGQVDYVFDEKAIVALIGHPLVFWENAPTVSVEVVKGEPELLVQEGKEGQMTLQLSPKLQENQPILVVKESPTRLKVFQIKPEHRRIAEILGKQNRLQVPAVAKERVLAAIGAVSGIVTVHSDIGGGVGSATGVPSDSKPHVHLLPAGAGLKVAVLARPFAQGGPYYRPGAGGATVIAEIDGQRLQTTRELREEKRLAKAAIAACPTLVRQPEQEGEWRVEDPEDCLELLLELQALGENIVLEWPEGEKIRVSHQASLQNLRLKIQRQNDWFATSGELKLDDTLVLDMQHLLELLQQAPGRFIPLGDGQFLALTHEFRKRLEELQTFADKQGKGLRIHPLAALAMEDWVNEVGTLQADQHWKTHIRRLREMQSLQPQLPSTLQAELRDYQLEGFQWMARLAHWGVGACLADDMGLGKTVQALAVILTRAPAGPTLIVAPTSVCMNWLEEAHRFAPTLNLIQLGSGDRQKVLNQLQPFDMLVCSYGLLQQEEVAEMLAQVQWQTIVLDEAQSIKNFATKRSQAAMTLQGGFKLITTGTPIENHLGELWNLFRFINPGLLGSLEHFNQRFATPIERYQDERARQHLKKLIQPFLLRRTKNQVLQELPSRTEILLHVELSREELAFYEALRQEAVAKLADSDAVSGAKHLQVLAEIMRLRRACCNTRLVAPDLGLPSAKLTLFGEVLAELLENRHKALVFSQFVDHLHLIRDYLDQQQIRYQYLDGSTPASERKKRVTAFQSGEGDVFLISLKAGGTGLNLTAADYVIHMDPWWNPAVEDQASDRAHRIGQQRPVTIYRLVAKHTIEEKIVNLHQHKRDLADSLLEGTEMSGKMSTDELLRLISSEA